MGRAHTLALVILGAWLGATLLMWFVATGSFSTVERILRAPDPRFSELTRPLGAEARTVFRHLASESNRTFFRVYGWGQIALGALLLLFLLVQTPRDAVALALAGFMLTAAVVLTLIVTPQIVVLGRGLDFLPRDPAPDGMARFRTLHALFTGLDGTKLLAGLGLLIRWIAKQ